LRALSRIVYQPVGEAAVSLVEVVDEVRKDFEATLAERQVQLRIGSLPPVRGFRTLLIELYRNLLSNALKYGSTAGLVIECTAEPAADGVILGVRNNGSVVPAEETERIFQPFFRLPNGKNREGTGMGLMLCRKIVERHGGRIWAESSEAAGTHIRFTLGEDRYAKD
jgi:signal transduction histidine kinase